MEYLESQYAKILNRDIPKTEKARGTFFDIAGLPHYENVISNFYAYYLDPGKEHGLGDLFLRALVSLLPEESPAKYMASDDVVVSREVHTKLGNFIDLVIGVPISEKADSYLPDEPAYTYDTALVIENKIYAWVYNNLEDYYQSVTARKKQGIVLSLREEKISNPKFINITHGPLIKKIKELINENKPNIESRENIILEDFIKNLENLTMRVNYTEQIKFFHSHSKQIAELVELRNQVSDALFQQLTGTCALLDLKLKVHSKRNDR